MGAYGSPELQRSEYQPVDRWHVCRYCGIQYNGNFCPECGTKVGEKKPKHITPWKIFGWMLLGCAIQFAMFILIAYFGSHIIK